MKHRLSLILLVLALVANGICIGQETTSDSKLSVEEIYAKTLKQAEQGDLDAHDNLGFMYLYGGGVPQNTNLALQWFLKAAEHGYARSQYNLGVLFAEGKFVPQDYKQAVEWYKKAAEQGYAPAQFNLGVTYFKGDGIPRDNKQAAEWFRKAAEQGHANSQFFLGVKYEVGDGIPQDYKQAVEWYRKAAEQGYAPAQFLLGRLYNNGEGVQQDYKQAVEWYRKAAEQGDAQAQYNLGVMYDNGQGVPQNYILATEWYRKAAEQGHAEAQYNLGAMYRMGQGVIEDFVEAYKWFLLAGMNGQDVSKMKQFLSEKMTAGQIAEAQERAKSFVAKKENVLNVPQLNSTDEDLPKSVGSGFFTHQGGYLVTAAHVVEGASKVEVWAGQKKLPAKVLVKDADIDVAILKIEETWTGSVLPITGSGTVKTGDPVFTVGFPNIDLQGTEPKYTEGSVSSLTGVANSPRLFQISVAVQPGNSGGPLLDQKGNVVGVVIAKLKAKTALIASGTLPENVNYAVKSSFVLPLLETIPDFAEQSKPKSPVYPPDRAAIIEQTKAALALIVCY